VRISLTKSVGFTIISLSFIYLLWVGYQQWGEFAQNFPHKTLWWGLLIAIIAYASACGLLLTLAWYKIILFLGGQITLVDSIKIYGRSQVAKYLPGNVFHYVGRHLLAKEMGLPNGIIVFSALLEAVLLIIVALGLTVFSLVLYGWHYDLKYELAKPWFFLVMILASLIILLFIYNFPLSIKKYLSKDDWLINLDHIPFSRIVTTLIYVSVIYLTFFTTIGLLLWFIAQNITPVINGRVLVFIIAYSFSWAIGFITPGAPGGIGIREALLVALLSPIMGGEAQAIILALIFRIATISGDGVFFITTCFIGSNNKQATHESNGWID